MTEISHDLAFLDARFQGFAGLTGLQRKYFDLRESARSFFDDLDMSENDKRGAIFVHVPKCAGTTIATQVKIAHGHRSAFFLRLKDPELFQSCFTFGFVRNPYDRFVSAFHYLRSDQTSRRDAAWGKRYLGRYEGFGDFAQDMTSAVKRQRVLGWLHFLPQTYFLCDRRNKIIVDYVGRQERFSEDLEKINDIAGLGLENKRMRSVARDGYKDFYTAETARVVDEIYAEDFEVFGYPRETDFAT